MNNRSILEGRVTNIFGIFMIFVYAVLGILMLFVIDWQDVLPRTNRLVIGCALLLYAAFRTYMLFRFRTARNAQHSESRTDEAR